jgi:hypothetical protein
VKKGAKHSFALSQNDKKFNKIYLFVHFLWTSKEMNGLKKFVINENLKIYPGLVVKGQG